MQQTKYDMYNSLSMAELNKIWGQVQEHIIPWPGPGPNTKNCIITNYSSDKGRPQVRHNGKKYYISIVLCLRKIRINNPNYNIPFGYECSHICNNHKCINADWLAFESGPVNKSRGCCELYKDTNGYFCPHDPICHGCKGIVGHNVIDDDDDDDNDDDDDIDMLYDENHNLDILKLFGVYSYTKIENKNYDIVYIKTKKE